MSLLDLLNDLAHSAPAETSDGFVADMRLVFGIAESCDNPEDCAGAALWHFAREADRWASFCRERIAHLAYGSESIRDDYAERASAYERIAARIRAALEPAQPMKEAA